MKRLAGLLCLCMALPGAARAQDPERPRVLSARDTLRINAVSSPALSPSGEWVLYTRRERDMDDEEMKALTHVWRVRSDGSERRQITFGTESCSSPAWFPDGTKIAFLSSRGSKGSGGPDGEGGPKSQIFFMHADGGEAWKVTDHEESIQSFRISPDGSKVLFTSRDALSKEEKEKRKKKDDAEVVDEKFRFFHLWAHDVESGETERLTEGSFTVSDPQWAPGSDRIALVTRPNTLLNEGWKTDVRVVNLDDKELRKLHENPGPDFSPRWSPDGRTIAFLSEPTAGTSTWHPDLLLIPAGGGEKRVLLEDFDYRLGSLIWSRDGRRIFAPAGDRTTVNVLAVNASSGAFEKIKPPHGSNRSFELSHSGDRWVYVHTPSSWPDEVYTADLEFKQPRRLSDANAWLRDEKVQLARQEVIQWKNSEGQTIEGVLTNPVGYEEGKRYPLILNPHGGPSGAVTKSFSSSNQFLAGNGFMILQPNFRGSSNYGQEFLNANRHNWGVVDYDDCMKGVDYCIDRGLADADRLICYGWSYGGYMSFWISTQTDRFKAISPGAGLTNLYSMYSTTDVSHYLGWFFGNPVKRDVPLGTPWDAEEAYEKHSPIRHVKNVTSPMLILHGARDARVPPGQAVEFYRALKDLGRVVTFVRYPREGHGLREPRHQIDRLRRYLFFFAEAVGLVPISEPDEEKPPREITDQGERRD